MPASVRSRSNVIVQLSERASIVAKKLSSGCFVGHFCGRAKHDASLFSLSGIPTAIHIPSEPIKAVNDDVGNGSGVRLRYLKRLWKASRSAVLAD